MTLGRGTAAMVMIVAFSSLCAAQAGPAQPKFAGRLVGVYDDRTGEPIDSAEVLDLTTKSFALTTSTGTLSLFFVDTAGGLLRIRKLGYTPLTVFVQNAPGDPPLTITLEPIAKSLPAVVTVDSARTYINPALRGFEERRLSGQGGRFVPEATIRKEEDRPLGNIIQAHVPGLNVLQNVRAGARYADVAVSTRNGKPCPVDIYLDGLPMSLQTTATGAPAIPQPQRAGSPRMTDPGVASGTNDLKDFLPKTLAGIEYHSTATVPPQFNRTASGCGVLLLWTRER